MCVLAPDHSPYTLVQGVGSPLLGPSSSPFSMDTSTQGWPTCPQVLAPSGHGHEPQIG